MDQAICFFSDMSNAFFFGYGSLVNRKTHEYPVSHPVKIKGWRRVWRHTTLRPLAILSVERDPDTEIEGLVAHVPNEDWAALDDREFAYDRTPLTQDDIAAADDKSVSIYEIPRGKHPLSAAPQPILLSYLDVVVQGYHKEFGARGVAQFFETTFGWDAPVLDDRTAPQYPRHQKLSSSEYAMVDQKLKQLDCRFISGSDVSSLFKT